LSASAIVTVDGGQEWHVEIGHSRSTNRRTHSRLASRTGTNSVRRGTGAAGLCAIILTEDDGPPEDKPTLAAAAAKDRVQLLRYAIHLGRGRALKTDLNNFLNTSAGVAGL